MNIWFLRMAKWVRRPPSEKRARFVLVVVLICAVVAGIEALGLWPHWATAERMPFRGFYR